jgi:hypothetical protein
MDGPVDGLVDGPLDGPADGHRGLASNSGCQGSVDISWLEWQMARVGRGSHGPSAASSSGQFRLGSGRPIEEVVRFIPLHFHLPITTSDVLQLLLCGGRWRS